MSASRQPVADLTIRSKADPANEIIATKIAYGRMCRVSAVRHRRWIAGAALSRGELWVLIEGLTDLHATMTPEA